MTDKTVDIKNYRDKYNSIKDVLLEDIQSIPLYHVDILSGVERADGYSRKIKIFTVGDLISLSDEDLCNKRIFNISGYNTLLTEKHKLEEIARIEEKSRKG